MVFCSKLDMVRCYYFVSSQEDMVKCFFFDSRLEGMVRLVLVVFCLGW